MSDNPRPTPGQDWQEPTLGMAFVWVNELRLWVGKYAVANGEFRRFRPAHDSGEFLGHSLNGDRQPVVQVSFNDANEFAGWLRAQALAAGVPDRFIFRLPSHTDWATYAAAGRAKHFPWGDEWPPTYGNYGDEAAKRAFPEWEVISGYDDGFAVSCPVEQAGLNEIGLCGVGGNVYEWTFVAGGTGTELRGASWSTYQPEYLRLNNRLRREATSKLVNFGFRLVVLE
jgi:formylglycine-generating enzyme required for sulfatase activity